MSDSISDEVDDMNTSFHLFSQANWRAWESGTTSRLIFEYPLYTDARILGERTEGLGPYSFLNTVPLPDSDQFVPAPIIVRASIHLAPAVPPVNESSDYKTDDELYHGGLLIDEIAALASLCLGIRIRCGGESREFEPGKDPLGRPVGRTEQPRIVLKIPKGYDRLPRVGGKRSLDQLQLLDTIPQLSDLQFVSLIRACRLYQDALWLSQSDPNLSWLMLVSALEAGANEFKSSKGSPVERLRLAKKDFADELERRGGDDLVELIAEEFANLMGATKKFLDFSLKLLPDEPKNRPDTQMCRVKWSKTSLKKILSRVYSYRSRALHGGVPFPAPMLDAPMYISENNQPSEKPLVGIAAHSRGGTWVERDAPINLHMFHYITRGVLLNWWKSMADS